VLPASFALGRPEAFKISVQIVEFALRPAQLRLESFDFALNRADGLAD
jgi:hypothetical protein